MLKWEDKQNGVDDVLAEDINNRYYGTSENGNGVTVKISAYVIGRWK